MSLPAHLEALRDEALRTSCESWAIRMRWKLARGIDRSGPCPACGGEDRFAIHTRKDTFNCRVCGIKGHGVIDLVMAVDDVDFTRACEIVTGRSAAEPVDEAKAEANRRRNEADAAARERAAEEYRENARKLAYKIWRRSYGGISWVAPQSDPVVTYLRRRGIDFHRGDDANFPVSTIRLYAIDAHPWTEMRGSMRVTVHTGPAMIAAVQRPDGTFGAVHQTWLDPAQPKGKLVLPLDDDGKERPSKKVLGVKKGGAIRLFTPSEPRRIVMGEGIETTLTALAHNFEPETAYWAGVDLGNMAGRAARGETGGQIWDQPDLDDFVDPRSGALRQPLGVPDCFLPPDWCEELVYLCDSDDPQNHTEEKVIRGLRRALRLRQAARHENSALPPLSVSYVEPIGDGKDLNDLVRVA